MHLQTVGWDHIVKAINGKEFFLVDVIAMILKFVKDRLLNIELGKSTRGVFAASDFDWVITVLDPLPPGEGQVESLLL